MFQDTFQPDYESIAEQAQQRWWGPSLASVLSELRSCQEVTGYLDAVVEEGKNAAHCQQLLEQHCWQRARIDLWSSLHLALSCLTKAPIQDVPRLLIVIGQLIREYFAWHPNTHLELACHMALRQNSIVNGTTQRNCCRQLRCVIGKLA